MADRRPRRMGPLLVWVSGLLIILLGIGMLVRWVGRRGAAATVAVPPATAVWTTGSPEAAVRAEAIAEVERSSVGIPLESVIPLGPADTGILATFDGDVVGAAVEGGAWVRSVGGHVVFIRVVDGGSLPLEAGTPLAGRGVVRYDPERVRVWLRRAGLGPAERSGIIPEYYLETTLDRLEL